MLNHLPDLIDRAIGFAAKAHVGGMRKASSTPYIAHPMGVAMILQRYGYPEEVIAAALLHDTIEDTAVTIADIDNIFGADVAAIVAGCTEPRGIWEDRKTHSIHDLRHAPITVKMLVAADKYHNLCHIRQDYTLLGEEVWTRFNRPKANQSWYYHQMYQSITMGIEIDQHPLLRDLAEVIDLLFADTPPEGPHVP